jgi:hypothetical protein
MEDDTPTRSLLDLDLAHLESVLEATAPVGGPSLLPLPLEQPVSGAKAGLVGGTALAHLFDDESRLAARPVPTAAHHPEGQEQEDRARLRGAPKEGLSR